MAKKSAKELEIGGRFRFDIESPKGHLILEIYDKEDDGTPWCLVTDHHYETPAEDEFEEEDRYKRGDTMPFVFDDEVEVL